MDESRELRDKLERVQSELRQSKEAMARLRAHHAREQESLVRQLEEARRELAELRARVLPGGRSEPVPPPARPAPTRVEHLTGSTGLVALLYVPELQVDEFPQRLARVTQLGVADLRLRLAAPPPVILLRLPPHDSRKLRDTLRAEGFSAVSCELPSRAASPLSVRRFLLAPMGMRVEGERGERVEVAWSDLRLMVHGRRTTVTVETQQEIFVDTHGERRARNVDVRKEESSHFLWGYGQGLWMSFSRGTDFNGLGERRGLSHTTSLLALIDEVRQRAPHVVFDDRLLKTPHLSLPMVDPERSHETIGELLWQSVLDGVL